jgi:signal transduction histidine kinase
MTRRAVFAAYGVVAVLTAIGLVGLWRSEDQIDTRLLLTFLVVGLGLSLSGGTVLTHGVARTSPSALLAAGLALLLGAALATFGVGAARPTGIVGLTIALPVAVVAFPARSLKPTGVRLLVLAVVILGAAALPFLDEPNALATVIATQITLVAADLWWRTERSTGDLRRSLLWLTYGFSFTLIAGGHVVFLVDGGKARTVDTLALLAALLITLVVPVTMAIGALAPRLRDIRQLISQTVLYVVMLELSLAIYIGSISALKWAGAEVTPQQAAILVIALAAGFHPAAVRIRRLLDELLFGGSADPVATMSAFGAHLRAETDPRSWAEALRTALSLPRVEIWQNGELIASAGEPVELSSTTALVAGDEEVGALVVGLPGDATSLPRATQGVINLVAAPLARALQAVQLADQLQASRGQVVAALEEERRRLRRDLHDGLGPVLAGVGYTADAARNLVRTDPTQAEELLTALRADAASAIADIRRIVVGLRPPALDELGLVGAVRQQTARLHSAGGQALAVRVVDRGSPLPALPAAVEVAAYRIAVEAVTNTSRHSSAREVVTDFDVLEGALVLTVTDDGPLNGADSWRPGVGLSSMRERCEQLGGSLEAGPTAGGGRVRATLPL